MEKSESPRWEEKRWPGRGGLGGGGRGVGALSLHMVPQADFSLTNHLVCYNRFASLLGMNTTSELTPDIINAATGRELDALVAEHVFGIGRDLRLKGSTETVYIYSDNPFYRDGQQTRNELHQAILPDAYSTNGNAMLAVLDRMRELDFAPRLYATLGSGWLVEMWKRLERSEYHSLSLPEAVCRAALLAILAQKEAQ